MGKSEIASTSSLRQFPKSELAYHFFLFWVNEIRYNSAAQ